MRNLAEQNIANFRSNLQSNYCKNRYYTRIFILTVSIFYFTIFIFRQGRKHISTKEHIRKAEAFIVEPDIYNLHIIPLNQYQEKTINRHYSSLDDVQQRVTIITRTNAIDNMPYFMVLYRSIRKYYPALNIVFGDEAIPNNKLNSIIYHIYTFVFLVFYGITV